MGVIEVKMNPKKPIVNTTNGTLEFHFFELRKRLIWSILLFIIVFITLYPFSPDIFNFLVQPLGALFNDQDSRRLIYTGLPEAFMVHVKISFCAIWISLPFIIYQCWIFISP